MSDTFTVPDMSCAHCKATVEGAVSAVDGVRSAEVDLDSKTVAVEYGEAPPGREVIVGALEEAGYPIA